MWTKLVEEEMQQIVVKGEKIAVPSIVGAKEEVQWCKALPKSVRTTLVPVDRPGL